MTGVVRSAVCDRVQAVHGGAQLEHFAPDK